jgi:hypothetical protein
LEQAGDEAGQMLADIQTAIASLERIARDGSPDSVDGYCATSNPGSVHRSSRCDESTWRGRRPAESLVSTGFDGVKPRPRTR